MAAGLLVLAGGRSRRMGTAKSLLPADAEGAITLIELVVARLSPEFGELLIAGPPAAVPQALQPHLIADLHPGAGPLAGLEAGLAATRYQVLFALATDMPFLTPAAARMLVVASTGHDAAVPRLGGRPEPLAAAYRTSAAGSISAAIAEARLAVHRVLDQLNVAYLDGLDPHLFVNLNTPAEHRRFLDSLRQKG